MAARRADEDDLEAGLIAPSRDDEICASASRGRALALAARHGRIVADARRDGVDARVLRLHDDFAVDDG